MKGDFTTHINGKVALILTLGLVTVSCGEGGDAKVKRVGLKPIEVRDSKAGSGVDDPDDKDPDDKDDPANTDPKDSVAAFSATLYPSLKDYCGSCHAKAQPPLFASDDKKVAHDSLLESHKVDFKDVEKSRVFLRVAKENHNCPDGDCDKAAVAFKQGITDWVAKINTTDPDAPKLPMTATLGFTDATDSSIEVKNPPGVFYFEAEKGTLANTFAAVSSEQANGGLFVHIPAGSAGSTNNAATSIANPNAGTVTFDFDVTEAGNYYLFGRVAGDTLNNNAFFVRMDGANALMGWQFNMNPEFTWDRADNVVAAGPALTFNLTAGPHKLEIRQREQLARLDAIVIANNQDFDPASASTGDEAVKKLTYDISTLSGIPGAKFTVALSDYSANAYLFRNPSIELPDGAKLKVKNVKLYINGKYLPQHATYTNVNTEVTGPVTLLSGAGLVALKDKPDNADEFSFEFEVLEKVP
jgi:hypothetical protein